MSSILLTALIIGAVGLVCGIVLAIVAQKFAVPENPLVSQILEILPGANCGGCGRPGCDGYAHDIAEKGAPINLCTACTADMLEALAALTGQKATLAERRVALVRCAGNTHFAKRRFDYNGLADCASVQATAGGDKSCSYGCLGYGSCVRACPNNAIVIVEGVAVVNPDRCIGCGACVKACPRQVIALVPASQTTHVLCSSKDKGPVVRKVCSVGCLGCGICAKLAPGAAKLEGTLAAVDPTQPLDSALAATLTQKCPGHCIQSLHRP